MVLPMLECVPNVSEGEEAAVLHALVAACGSSLLDVHRDADHHRSVFTLAGPGPQDASDAVRNLAERVADLIDLSRHRGVHPRLGALDVVPFVALDGTDAGRERARASARAFAEWWSGTHRVPCFFYDEADDARRTLPTVRRDAFTVRSPDTGPAAPHPTLGATAVGVRDPLVALNCMLDTDDVQLARDIAARVRDAGGGLPGVRALGLALERRGCAQVSMNLVNLQRTGIEAASERVRELARDAGAEVAQVELVGLAPAAELDRCSAAFIAWSRIDPTASIEYRRSHGGWAETAGAV